MTTEEQYLLDQFAGLAMQAIVRATATPDLGGGHGKASVRAGEHMHFWNALAEGFHMGDDDESYAQAVASESYKLAEAMLDERAYRRAKREGAGADR
jgi:hypothetical protein